MKKLFIILTVLFGFLVSCGSPEQKIIRSIQQDRIGKHIEIKSVEIYDTLSIFEVQFMFPILQNNLAEFEEQFHKFDNIRDSIHAFHNSKSIYDSVLNKEFLKRDKIDHEIDHINRMISIYYSLYNSPTKNNDAAYFVKIVTDRDTLDLVVSTDTYKVICPTFMFN
jgi:hypothetical protein